MNCPKCNAVIPDGCLICESCGTEIQIVPDFELNVDKEISETLSDVRHDIFGTQDLAETVDQIQEEYDDNPFIDDEKSERTRRKLGIIFLLTSVVICAFCALIFVFVHRSSVDYLLRKAAEMSDKGAYTEAISYIQRAEEKQPNDADLQFLMADYLLKDNRENDAALIYQEMIESDTYPDNHKFLAYDKLIKFYKDREKFQEINTLLENCKYESIISTYQNYLANIPEFSIKEGTYDEVLSLRLNSNTSGKIYYTTDGSVPTEKSEIYSGPILLESGKYVINAMFINIYGIQSDVVSKEYFITLTRPEQPVVSLESGVYNQAAMISVTCESGCRIFYTTDDTTPTMDSVPYTGAIPMPLGSTNFQFISMNNAGICSEPLIRTYELRLDNSISTDEAVNILLNVLVERGVLLDTQGHKANTSGVYSYVFSSVIHATDGNDYYTINEQFDDGTGIPVRTDVVYLTGAYTGEVYRLGFNDVGRFAAIPF